MRRVIPPSAPLLHATMTTTTIFDLDHRLAADCLVLGDAPLCRLLMMNNADYPWFILVPRRASVREMHDLDAADRAQLFAESCALALAMEAAFAPDSLNVAKLGNVVAQLHLHHVARYRTDPAWPGPVWGRVGGSVYTPDQAQAIVDRLRKRLGLPVAWSCAAGQG